MSGMIFLTVMLQAAVPPRAHNWEDLPLGVDVPEVTWNCKLVDKVGRVFPVAGQTPSFVASEKRSTTKAILLDGREDKIVAGKQSVRVIQRADDLAVFHVDLSSSTPDNKYHVTLFFNSWGGGLATVHTRDIAAKRNGYYATGLCQSDFGRI